MQSSAIVIGVLGVAAGAGAGAGAVCLHGGFVIEQGGGDERLEALLAVHVHAVLHQLRQVLLAEVLLHAGLDLGHLPTRQRHCHSPGNGTYQYIREQTQCDRL